MSLTSNIKQLIFDLDHCSCPGGADTARNDESRCQQGGLGSSQENKKFSQEFTKHCLAEENSSEQRPGQPALTFRKGQRKDCWSSTTVSYLPDQQPTGCKRQFPSCPPSNPDTGIVCATWGKPWVITLLFVQCHQYVWYVKERRI